MRFIGHWTRLGWGGSCSNLSKVCKAWISSVLYGIWVLYPMFLHEIGGSMEDDSQCNSRKKSRCLAVSLKTRDITYQLHLYGARCWHDSHSGCQFQTFEQHIIDQLTTFRQGTVESPASPLRLRLCPQLQPWSSGDQLNYIYINFSHQSFKDQTMIKPKDQAQLCTKIIKDPRISQVSRNSPQSPQLRLCLSSRHSHHTAW